MGVCEETVEDGCDSLLMPVCGSFGGMGTSWSEMGYHGNILLKTNAGEGEVNRSMVVKTSNFHR